MNWQAVESWSCFVMWEGWGDLNLEERQFDTV